LTVAGGEKQAEKRHSLADLQVCAFHLKQFWIDMALNEFVNKNAYHPVRDYLNSLVWDGKPRVEGLLIDFMGSEDNDYVRTVTRMTFVACVARVFEPGIKFDTILTLVGEQGGGKSTLLSKLAKDWFSDSISDIGNKDALQLLQGNWIIELGELSAIKKADIEHLKQFITRQVDEFRPPYGRITQRFPRQCVFFGTTNKVGFLCDPTGGRRFLPVHYGPKEITVEKVNNLTRDYVDQFWAEVVYLYKLGERLYLNPMMSGEAEKIRRGFEQDEPLAGVIERYLDLPLPPNWESLSISERRYFVEHEVTFQNEKGNKIRNQVCVAEIAVECLGLEQGQIARSKSNEITDILTKLEGWEKSSQGVRIKGYGRQRVFIRSGTNFC
jgi:putative DNA primase/helicase